MTTIHESTVQENSDKYAYINAHAQTQQRTLCFTVKPLDLFETRNNTISY